MTKVKETSSPLPGVDEDRFALQFESLCHRFGLIFLLIIVVAALAGFFSNGYFSETIQKSPNNILQVHYERFGRLQTPVQVKISLHLQNSQRLTLRLGQDYMTHFETENIWPQPDEMRSDGTDIVLVYNEVTPQQPFTVWLYTTPDQPGKAVTTVSVNNEPGIRFWQFIYP
ncbi:hypothetical protein [Leclercia sp. UBA2479]|uniref:hypothetical protein n=1 Tax=Leclercia sp. UBA2479 TaxID=1946738 RepID=UPI00062C272B|nr:hypothetical protein [Leclercia sp. UBA2479]KKY85530.1 hypothetical protein OA46_13325 [Enterobacter cloacae]